MHGSQFVYPNLTNLESLLRLTHSFMIFPFEKSQPVTEEEIIKLGTENIPRWRAACDNSEADTLVLQQQAFGSSTEELFLIAIAIKYAGIAKKTVMIAP